MTTIKLPVAKQLEVSLFSTLTKISSSGPVTVYGFGKTGAPMSALP